LPVFAATFFTVSAVSPTESAAFRTSVCMSGKSLHSSPMLSADAKANRRTPRWPARQCEAVSPESSDFRRSEVPIWLGRSQCATKSAGRRHSDLNVGVDSLHARPSRAVCVRAP
jgi:hypothetical protein